MKMLTGHKEEVDGRAQKLLQYCPFPDKNPRNISRDISNLSWYFKKLLFLLFSDILRHPSPIDVLRRPETQLRKVKVKVKGIPVTGLDRS